MKKLFPAIVLLLAALMAIPAVSWSSGYHIAITDGNNQKIQVGKTADKPLVLRVTDSTGKPAQVTIQFKTVKGEVKFSPSSVKTDESGRAKFFVIAGVIPGDAVVKAEVANMPATGVQLNYTITLDKPDKGGKPEVKKPVSGKSTVALKPINKEKVPTVKPAATPAAPATPEPAKTPTQEPTSLPTPEPTPAPTPAKTATPEPAKTPEVKKPVASVIIGFSGNNQEIPVGTTGQDEIAVQIMDADGNPMSGVTVKFSVIDGSATLSPDKSVSNEKGIATTKAKAGNKTGAIDIKADVVGVSDLSTTFNLKAISKAPAAVKTPTVVPSPANTPRTVSTPIAPSTPQVDETPYIPDTIKLPSKTGGTSRTTYSREPANISVVAGNFQMSEPGVRLQQPVVVYVTDSDSNPTFATVSFTVMSGNATIINKEVQTDARGLASTFVVVNTTNPIKIVAEVVEKPGLSTIAFANTQKPEAKAKTEGNAPIIRSTTPSNTPGYPASIAFYDLKAKNTGNIEKTKVMQLEIGVSDFRNAPVSTAIKFTCLKGDIKVLTPIVQTTADGKGICYVEIAGSMGIFTIEAQSMENPDLRALFKSGPEIRTGPSPKVVRPGTEEPTSMETKEPAGGMTVKPPAGSGASGQPALVAVVQGGGQRAKIRSKLNDPIIILVTDADGKPVEGAHVSFYLKSGRAILSATMARTNGDGKAQISVTLGKTPGVCEIGVKVRENKDLDTTVHLEAIQ